MLQTRTSRNSIFMDALNFLQELINLGPLIPLPHLQTSNPHCIFKEKVNKKIIIYKQELYWQRSGSQLLTSVTDIGIMVSMSKRPILTMLVLTKLVKTTKLLVKIRRLS